MGKKGQVLQDFPLNSMSDFESLLGMKLGWLQRQDLLKNSRLFLSPDLSHEGQRKHSAIVDKLLGFEVEDIENGLYKKARLLRPEGSIQNWGHSLHQGNQTWVGLDPQTLQTPYTEIFQMLQFLGPDLNHLVDLGAGYGRMALVLAQVSPESLFTGHEIVQERVTEGSRVLNELSCTNAKLIEQDLMDPSYSLTSADAYFLYDFGKVGHIRYILNQLKNLADTLKFKVIARGKGSRSLIDYEHPWLSQVFDSHHEEFFSIYSMF